jgi:para-nitrobenzyl esterase
VYYYLFAKPRPAKSDRSAGPDPGAVHSGEIEYALGNLATNRVYAWTDDDRRVSAIMEGYFANFIETGDPNGAGLPRWPSAASKDGGLLRQSIGVDTRTRIDRNVARYESVQRMLKSDARP